MFQSLQGLFGDKKNIPLREASEEDVRYFVERYLRGELKTDGIVCQGVKKGVLFIRVSGPVFYEQILLREYDLRQVLKKELAYSFLKMAVVIG